MRPVRMANADQFFGSLLLVTALAAVGCGGKSATPVKSPAPDTEAATEKDEAPPEKSGPDCSDGTCIACGDAQCPKGFFCDESTSKPSCQWVPTCTDSVSCSCVERSLSGKCSCTERDGGSYVRCEG